MSEVQEEIKQSEGTFAPEDPADHEDHPFSWIFTALGCAAVAGAVHTSLWDDQIAGSSTHGRYRALRGFMQAVGPTWISVIFGVMAVGLLLVGVREIRAAYKD
ncbi:hypothetical protein ABIA33_004826 [Streptacidiphilus sp. MAP12-16]|uniref:hypothetical protein n=1 Tax=Streptacidiphilus sp. MAP12-16 TaxID=3156300 RepID=UPI003512EE35